MRTTLDIDEDVLRLAKDLASEARQSVGKVLSNLARQGLQPSKERAVKSDVVPVLSRNPGARPVTSQHVKDLMELDR